MTQYKEIPPEVKELFYYDEESGKMYWKVNRCNRKIKIGDEAGTRNKSNGYKIVMINYKLYLVHRIIWKMRYGILIIH